MLVLARTAGQQIHIDGDIRVTVLEVGPGARVRLGIEAPASVSIERAELRDRGAVPPGTAAGP